MACLCARTRYPRVQAVGLKMPASKAQRFVPDISASAALSEVPNSFLLPNAAACITFANFDPSQNGNGRSRQTALIEKGTIMPADTIVLLAFIATIFAVFAATLAWGEVQTRN